MENSGKVFERIPDDPLMTIEITEPAIGLEGWVCLHALGKGGASGGIRCVGDVTKKEVQLLARAMTYKFSFFGIPQGGAKAGLRVGYDIDPERKALLIRAAARHLEPLVRRSTVWSPWTDMNFYGDDLMLFYAEMGRNYTPNPHSNSSHRTAISAFWSLQACLEYYGLNPKETRLALEGFGSVASYLTPYLARLGIKVVAVSNHHGTLANPEGLDLSAIDRLRARYGSAWVDQPGDWRRLEREALFEIEADILVPCARVHSIGPEEAGSLSARLVLPIANVPCQDEALAVLDRRGIDYIPDFVVNGGGISGHIQDINDPFGKLFKAMLRRMLKAARKRGRSVRAIAEEAAHANYGRIVSEAYLFESLPLKIVKGLARRGLLPKACTQNFQRDGLSQLYANMEELFVVKTSS